MWLSLAVGVALSALVAGFAFARGSLTRGGALSAVVVGTAIYVGGGEAWFLALLVFFATSTLLGRVGMAHKTELARDYQKGDRRDASQVFCNGGVAALCALSVLWSPSPWTGGAFLGALATANGDTWATELGVLSKRPPFSLTQFRSVHAGSSGAVSALGLFASLAGGLAVGLVAWVFPRAFGLPGWVGITAAGAAGLVGSLADSLLGATLQAGYRCEACRRDTEAETHACGAPTTLVRGFRFFDNDAVNLVATLTGAVVGGLLEFALEPATML